MNETLPQQELQPLIMHQEDGAPLHWNLAVWEFLNQTISGHWIGSAKPISQLPWSLDFTLCGYM